MVKTKDSAALCSSRRWRPFRTVAQPRKIGRVRSHKRSLRNQFHLFVNTREDFHSPGGIPPQDCFSFSPPCSRSLFALAPGPFHYFWTEAGMAIVLVRQKVPSRIANTSRFARSSLSLSVFPLKNNRCGTSRKSESKTSGPANWLVTACRKSAGLLFSSVSFSLCSLITLALSAKWNAGRAQGYNFIFRSLSALFCGLFTPLSLSQTRRRFTLQDSRREAYFAAFRRLQSAIDFRNDRKGVTRSENGFANCERGIYFKPAI